MARTKQTARNANLLHQSAVAKCATVQAARQVGDVPAAISEFITKVHAMNKAYMNSNSVYRAGALRHDSPRHDVVVVLRRVLVALLRDIASGAERSIFMTLRLLVDTLRLTTDSNWFPKFEHGTLQTMIRRNRLLANPMLHKAASEFRSTFWALQAVAESAMDMQGRTFASTPRPLTTLTRPFSA